LRVIVNVILSIIAMVGLSEESYSARPSEPDLVLQVHREFLVPSEGEMTNIRRFALPTFLAADRWIRGFDFHCTDSQKIRSVFLYVERTGQWIGGWKPGQDITSFPESVAVQLPSGSKLILEIHERGPDDIAADFGEVGLYFARTKPIRPLNGVGIESVIQVPPGEQPFLVRKEFTIIADSFAIALHPGMQSAGRSFQVDMMDPSGVSRVLMRTDDYQESTLIHYFGEPIFIPRGSRIVATATYENSGSVPLNDVFNFTLNLYPSAEFRPWQDTASVPQRSARASVKRKPPKTKR
jgi:hypothetical protein